MIAFSANNTLIGIRMDPRHPAIPAPLPDFGSEAELEVERQAHAVTRQDLADCRHELAQAHRLAHELAQQHSVDRVERDRLKAMLAGAATVMRQATQAIDRMADDGEYVVEVGS